MLKTMKIYNVKIRRFATALAVMAKRTAAQAKLALEFRNGTLWFSSLNSAARRQSVGQNVIRQKSTNLRFVIFQH